MSNRTFDDALPAGTMIAGFEIARALGQGGFGITYEAYNRVVDSRLALKECFPAALEARRKTATQVQVPPYNSKIFEWTLAKFEESTAVLARLKHPNIPKVMNYVSDHGTGYMLMEYVDGVTLEKWLVSGPKLPTLEELAPVLDPICDALEYVHGRNMLHRDVAPDNIMLMQDGRPVLIDFGAIKVLEDATRAKLEQQGRISSYSIMKPFYSSREQARGVRSLDSRTDVYSLGAVIYRALTGAPPPDVVQRDEETDDGRADPYVPISQKRADLPQKACEFIDRCLLLRRDNRPANVRDLRAALGWVDASLPTVPAPPSLPQPIPPPQSLPQPPEPQGGRRYGLPVAVVLLVGAIAAYSATQYFRTSVAPPAPPKNDQTERPKTPNRVQEPERFYDTVTGAPAIWYARNADGDFEFFDADGFHPLTGARLQRIDQQAIDEYRAQVAKKRMPKRSIADGHPWCRSRFGNDAFATAINSDDAMPYECGCGGNTVWNASRSYCVAAAPPQPQLIDLIVRSRWAVGGAANCNTPRSVYTLRRLDARRVLWRNGQGDTFEEEVTFSSEDQFTTTTISSRSHPPGTTWRYRARGPENFEVIQNNANVFAAARCP